MQQNKIYTVEPVIICAEDMICECGGVFEYKDSALISNPIKCNVVCPFCGNISYLLDTSFHIAFKIKDSN